MKPQGFTLVEVMVATAIFLVVSLMAYMVLVSSSESTSLMQAKSGVQGELRDVMTAVIGEARSAYSQQTVDAAPPISPDDTTAIQVGNNGTTLTFQVPEKTGDTLFVRSSAPIVFSFENEDAGEEPNARLDSGEDANDDGMLTRRMIRTQGDDVTVVGASSHISAVTFQLLPSANTEDDRLTRLRIRLSASERYGLGEPKLVVSDLEATINLEN